VFDLAAKYERHKQREANGEPPEFSENELLEAIEYARSA
jgi:hypothetical protein